MTDPIKIAASPVCQVIYVDQAKQSARVSFAGRLWDIKVFDIKQSGDESLPLDEQVAQAAAECFAHFQNDIRSSHQKLELHGNKTTDTIAFSELHSYDRDPKIKTVKKVNDCFQNVQNLNTSFQTSSKKLSDELKNQPQRKTGAEASTPKTAARKEIKDLSPDEKYKLIKDIQNKNPDRPITFYKEEYTPLTDFMGNFYEGKPIPYKTKDNDTVRNYKCAEGAFHASKVDYIDDDRLGLVIKKLKEEPETISADECKLIRSTTTTATEGKKPPTDNELNERYQNIANAIKASVPADTNWTTVNIRNIMKNAFANASGEDALKLNKGKTTVTKDGNSETIYGFDLYELMGDKGNPDFDVNKNAIMYNILKEKFTDPDNQKLLEATGSALLVEHKYNPNAKDTYWSDGYGTEIKATATKQQAKQKAKKITELATDGNNLGKILMMIRDNLQKGNPDLSYDEAKDSIKQQEMNYSKFCEIVRNNQNYFDSDPYSSKNLAINSLVTKACEINTPALTPPIVPTKPKKISAAQRIFGNLSAIEEAKIKLNNNQREALAHQIYPKKWYSWLSGVDTKSITPIQLKAIKEHLQALNDDLSTQGNLQNIAKSINVSDIGALLQATGSTTIPKLLHIYSLYLKKHVDEQTDLSPKFLTVLHAFKEIKDYVIIEEDNSGGLEIESKNSIIKLDNVDINITNFYKKENGKLKIYDTNSLKSPIDLEKTTELYTDIEGGGHCLNACLADQMNKVDPTKNFTKDGVREQISTNIVNYFASLDDANKNTYIDKVIFNLRADAEADENITDSKNKRLSDNFKNEKLFNKLNSINNSTLSEDEKNQLVESYSMIINPKNNDNRVAYLSDIHLEQYAKLVNKRIVVISENSVSKKMELANVFMPSSTANIDINDNANTLWLCCNLQQAHYYSMNRDLTLIHQILGLRDEAVLQTEVSKVYDNSKQVSNNNP